MYDRKKKKTQYSERNVKDIEITNEMNNSNIMTRSTRLEGRNLELHAYLTRNESSYHLANLFMNNMKTLKFIGTVAINGKE